MRLLNTAETYHRAAFQTGAAQPDVPVRSVRPRALLDLDAEH
jgi:hypothetical protein